MSNEINSTVAQEVKVCLEATGNYSKAISRYLYSAGYKISIVNPLQIKAYKRSKLLRDKTDILDAISICEYLKMYNPEEWKPVGGKKDELRVLSRCLKQYMEDKTRLVNRLECVGKNCIAKNVIMSSKKYLEEQISYLEKLIEEHIASDIQLKQEVSLIESIPGFGRKSSILLVSELPNLSYYNSARALASYSGICPRRIESGSSIRKRTRMSKVGSREIRKILYFPALVAKRYNPILSPFYDRLLARKKTKMSAIGAVMRKLLHIVFGVLKSGKSFDKDILNNIA